MAFFTRYCLVFLLVLLCNICRAGVFDIVAKRDITGRVELAQSIYEKQVRHSKDTVSAIASINELIALSKKMDDRVLQCSAISMLADHYARLRGFNNTSTNLHLQAIALAVKNKLVLVKGMSIYKMGRYYYSFNYYPLAFEYLLRADDIFIDIGYDEVPEIAGILFFLGNIYYETGDYTKAEKYYLDILQQKNVDHFLHIQALNTLALISKRQDSLAKALQYFEKTLAFASSYSDTTWIAISNGNIGSVYFEQQQYSKARQLLQASSHICLERKEWGDAYIAFLTLARIDVLEHRPADAQKRIDTAVSLQNHCNSISDRRHLYEALAPYYRSTGQLMQAIEAQQKLLDIRDTLSTQKDIRQYHNIKLRLETEIHLNDIARLEEEAKTATLKRNSIIAILVLVMVLLLVMYNRYLLKAKKNAEILQQKQALMELEKLRTAEELTNAEKQLQSFTAALLQKNQLVEKFSSELEKLQQAVPGNTINDERASNFSQLVQYAILTAEDWDNFRALFDKVYKNFFFHLKEKGFNFSETETRLLSLLKLQLSTREIANMLGVSLDAIKKAKQRLRKKIFDNAVEEELESWVAAV